MKIASERKKRNKKSEVRCFGLVASQDYEYYRRNTRVYLRADSGIIPFSSKRVASEATSTTR